MTPSLRSVAAPPRPYGPLPLDRSDIAVRHLPSTRDISVADADRLVLERLEASLYARSARQVEHVLLSLGEERLTAGAVEATLDRLASSGDAEDVSPFSWFRCFAITERGRERLRRAR